MERKGVSRQLTMSSSICLETDYFVGAALHYRFDDHIFNPVKSLSDKNKMYQLNAL